MRWRSSLKFCQLYLLSKIDSMFVAADFKNIVIRNRCRWKITCKWRRVFLNNDRWETHILWVFSVFCAFSVVFDWGISIWVFWLNGRTKQTINENTYTDNNESLSIDLIDQLIYRLEMKSRGYMHASYMAMQYNRNLSQLHIANIIINCLAIFKHRTTKKKNTKRLLAERFCALGNTGNTAHRPKKRSIWSNVNSVHTDHAQNNIWYGVSGAKKRNSCRR